MKFTVYYGQDFWEKGRQTGKLLAAKMAMDQFRAENPEGRIAIVGPSHEKDLSHDAGT